MEQKLLIDTKEAAEFITVSPRTLWSLTFEREPGLPFVRVGRLIRYDPQDLREWISENKQTSK